MVTHEEGDVLPKFPFWSHKDEEAYESKLQRGLELIREAGEDYDLAMKRISAIAGYAPREGWSRHRD